VAMSNPGSWKASRRPSPIRPMLSGSRGNSKEANCRSQTSRQAKSSGVCNIFPRKPGSRKGKETKLSNRDSRSHFGKDLVRRKTLLAALFCPGVVEVLAAEASEEAAEAAEPIRLQTLRSTPSRGQATGGGSRHFVRGTPAGGRAENT
jgi:hypothetical protein